MKHKIDFFHIILFATAIALLVATLTSCTKKNPDQPYNRTSFVGGNSRP